MVVNVFEECNRGNHTDFQLSGQTEACDGDGDEFDMNDNNEHKKVSIGPICSIFFGIYEQLFGNIRTAYTI